MFLALNLHLRSA